MSLLPRRWFAHESPPPSSQLSPLPRSGRGGNNGSLIPISFFFLYTHFIELYRSFARCPDLALENHAPRATRLIAQALLLHMQILLVNCRRSMNWRACNPRAARKQRLEVNAKKIKESTRSYAIAALKGNRGKRKSHKNNHVRYHDQRESKVVLVDSTRRGASSQPARYIILHLHAFFLFSISVSIVHISKKRIHKCLGACCFSGLSISSAMSNDNIPLL